MTTTTTTPVGRVGEAEVPTFTGWRKVGGMGLYGLSGKALVGLGVLVGGGFLLAVLSIGVFLVLAVPVVAVAVPLVARWRGETVWYRAKRRARWWRARRYGWTEYAGGVVGAHAGAWQLPGLLAPTTVLTADGPAGPYGLVWHHRTGLLTATLRVDARSTWLVEGAQSLGWVANWHAWLASLGSLPMVAWVAVTVDTVPEPGATIAERVARRLDPAAPPDALVLLGELVAAAPTAASDVATRVSITFDPSRLVPRLDDLDAQVAEVGRVLAGLETSLSVCGVSVLGRASPAELAGVVRSAFDPAARGEVNRLLADDRAAETLCWEEAGPVGAEEAWDSYRHDTGWSVSWGWHEAPRHPVRSEALVPLMSPGRWARRVSVLYRPLPADSAARQLHDQVNATQVRSVVRARQGRDDTARDSLDRQRALQAAREEAAGAGVVHFAVYVTTTVTDPADLPAAVADVESSAAAPGCQIRLRRLYAAQAAGFATTLPAGIHPWFHSSKRGRR